jgi:hypothetical protein
MTTDGMSSRLYTAESEGYEMTEVSSSSVSTNQGSGPLDGNTKLGDAEFTEGRFGGRKSITFKDSKEWSMSEL